MRYAPNFWFMSVTDAPTQFLRDQDKLTQEQRGAW